MNQDTIAAISTGMTNSGIGIVRISGSEALEIADRVYKGKETITEVPTHTIHYGHVMDGDETVDEVLVMVMRGPRTFTGEDTVEGILKRQDGSVTGRGGHRCDHIRK